MTEPLAVAFVWHMHQPYYKRSRTGSFDMPWVRLHALKDYLDMVELLSHYPLLHQTFNLVPSLVEQLQDYARGGFTDVYWDLSVKPADELEPAERVFVVDLMCERSWHPRAQRHPRYLELARKKEASLDQGIDSCAAAFSTAEIRDLQIWFNLAWFDPEYQRSGPLAELVTRGRDFAEGDKAVLAAAQDEILVRVLPTYREAEARGQIELTTSPYFHPIIPLLVNTDLARVARGDTPLPTRRFSHPEDAREQIERALAHHTRAFGRTPRGMWCSEQGIGEDVIPLMADQGVAWTIGDEGVLSRSLGRDIPRSDAGHVQSPDLLYRAYRLDREDRSLNIVFRDRVLSDLVGFTYQSWGPRDAAANLVWRLREARKNLASSAEPHLVTVALDGENAWEYYQGDGRDFLSYLYESLSADLGFRCVTVGEFLDGSPPTRELPWLHTGSWINADYSTWIGDPAHSAAWDRLHEARDFVAARRHGAPPPRSTAEGPASVGPAQAPPGDVDPDEAWHHILVAEGSDWFWWFGVHQESGVDHLWDTTFRRHLQDAYRCLGETPPPELFAPILAQAPVEEATAPSAWFTPVIDGRLTATDEWSLAGSRRAPRAGTMQSSEARVLEEVRFGCDEHNLYLLFLPGREGFPPRTRLAVYFGGPDGCTDCVRGAESLDHTRFHGRSRTDAELGFDLAYELEISVEDRGEVAVRLATVTDGEWGEGRILGDGAYEDVIEVALPLVHLGISAPLVLDFVIATARENVLVELMPPHGAISFDLAAVADSRRSADQT